MATKISRRALFRLRPREIISLFNEKEDPAGDGKQASRYIRPPSAVRGEPRFLSLCTRCDECIKACPHGAIERLTAVAGSAEGTPAMKPELNPCRWCSEMPCIQACKSGALRFEPDGSVSPIAKANFSRDMCLNEQGILCDSCAVHCPVNAKAIRMAGRRVRFDPEACTGCGLCAYFCEAEPVAFRIVPIQTADGSFPK